MAEQTFKSPGFFEREIEVISRPLVSNRQTPVGIVGPAEKGPAFVPVTVSSDTEFFKIFGHPDRYRYPAHAASEFFLEGGKALTFCRVLGSGLSAAAGDAKHAGFKVNGVAEDGRAGALGSVQFILANHQLNLAEHVTLGLFNDNDSHTTSMDQDPSDNNLTDDNSTDRLVQLARAVVFLKEGYSLRISDVSGGNANFDDDVATASSDGEFKLQVTDGADDETTFTVSLDPLSDKYLTKVLNTDSFSFTDKAHYLYADFPVDEAVASTKDRSVAVARGKDQNGDDPDYLLAYGNFNSRFTTPKSPMFISQPFGKKEYELFRLESLDDGSYASGKYKVSIVNLKASTEKNYKFGTFGIQLRDLNDTDDNPVVYEAYSNLSLDPNADNFVAKVIGDQRIKLSLDVDSEDEKRLIREGTYPNKSTRVRVVVSDDVLRAEAPEESLPFGFRGIPALFTTEEGTDAANKALLQGESVVSAAANDVGNAVLPPLPYRMKVTKGNMTKNGSWFQTYLGETSTNDETVKTFFYWGLMTTRVSDIENPNSATSSDISHLTHNLTKFLGASSDVVKPEGADSDKFNNNKFSLAKIAFAANVLKASEAGEVGVSDSVLQAFKEAVYVRNADADNELRYDAVSHLIKMSGTTDPFNAEDGEVTDAFNNRVSLAKLLAEDVVKFNKFSIMTKFTAPFYGGFDGVNILDEDDYYFTDRAASTVESDKSADGVPGHAATTGYASGLADTDAGTSAASIQGYGLDNNAVVSYRNAVKLMTDEMITTANVLVVPGIRESLITDYAAARVKEYGKAIYLMDAPHFDRDGKRIFTSAKGQLSGRPDVDETSSAFDIKELNSSYVASYFPDVTLSDRGDDDEAAAASRRSIRVPSSIVALGSLARTDRAGTPWFAPAGFSRGSLSRVKSLDVRLSAGDRDTLYEARLNPIANFPNNQFVIFGQKTTQIARTALDRVNVRRLMIRIKSDIQKIAQGLLFEQNDAPTRQRFIDQASNRLQQIRVGQGIEDFRVIMDDTNNSAEDVDNNRLNGRIIVVPTRAIEFIAMDFVITNSGVEFPA